MTEERLQLGINLLNEAITIQNDINLKRKEPSEDEKKNMIERVQTKLNKNKQSSL